MRRFMSWMSITTPWQFRVGVFVASFGAFSVVMLTGRSELGLGLGVSIIVAANVAFIVLHERRRSAAEAGGRGDAAGYPPEA